MNHSDAQTDAWMNALVAHVPDCWMKRMKRVMEQRCFQDLRMRIAEDAQAHTVVPPPQQVMRALRETPYAAVRAVLIGQDPYHGPGQACGLCFSVEQPHVCPPSLRNMFIEYHSDTGYPIPRHGDLSPWARAGVLLINAVWTTRLGVAGAHRGWGWEQWTRHIIRALMDHERPIVFLLWGKHALEWLDDIDQTRHGVLIAPHPSPLAAYRGFFGSKPFSSANAWLQSRGEPPIDWCLTECPIEHIDPGRLYAPRKQKAGL
jgi:uracil-DNA glycosylase